MTKTHDYLQYYLQITLLLKITIFAKINSEALRLVQSLEIDNLGMPFDNIITRTLNAKNWIEEINNVNNVTQNYVERGHFRLSRDVRPNTCTPVFMFYFCP